MLDWRMTTWLEELPDDDDDDDGDGDDVDDDDEYGHLARGAA